MNNKIIVTGGTGMVGQSLQKIMPNATYLSSKDCNLKNLDETIEFFKKEKPETIVHIAGRVGGILENLKYPVDFLEENIYINTNLCRAAHIAGTKNLIGVLSTCIYPENADHYPMIEDQLYNGPPPVQNFSYAYAKRCMAIQIDSYIQQYNKENWCYVIPCNLYGEDDKFKYERSHYVSSLIDKIYNSNDGKVHLLGTGKPLRQFMYSKDLALAIKLLIDKRIFKNVNIANDEVCSIEEIGNIALKCLGKEDLELVFSGNEKEDGNYRKDVSSDKLKKLLGGFEFTPLSEGIKKVYNIYKDRHES
jgi:GDP-L-fucose synthase